MKLNVKKLQNGQTIELTLPNGLKKKVETNSKEYKSLYPNVTTKINEDTYYKNLPDVNIIAKNWLSHSVRKANSKFRDEHEGYDYFAVPNWNKNNVKHILPYDLRISRDWTNPNIYKGLIPAAGLYGLTQSKKQGGKLIPKGQQGLKITKNYVEPFHNSPYNFLNKPIMKDFSYESAIPFIIEHEGKKLDKQGNHIIYKDGKGIDTIGYGLTSKDYISKGKITEEDARKGIRMHIDKEVLPHLKSKPYWNNLSENQKIALTSYVYNIGSGAFNTKSPLLQKALYESNWNEAAKQMDFGYNDTNNPGLKIRRDKERKLFLQDYDKLKLNQLSVFKSYLNYSR